MPPVGEALMSCLQSKLHIYKENIWSFSSICHIWVMYTMLHASIEKSQRDENNLAFKSNVKWPLAG